MMRRSPFGVLGVAGVALGCAGMGSMLPGVAVGALGAVGITGSGALARTLAPVAEPLFLVSAALILISALACSRLVATLSGAGVVLLYLSMFQLATGGAAGAPGLMSMTAMQQPHHPGSALHANTVTFYLGLVLLVSAAALRVWRRRRHECQPLLRIPRAGPAAH
jgi:hypothetical protein